MSTHQLLFEIAKGIAPLLTGQWRYNHLAEIHADYRYGNQAVINDDTKLGRQIVLRPSWEKHGRLKILGRDKNFVCSKNITVAQTRSIQAIAKDINRRLLPDFLKESQQEEIERKEREQALETYQHQVNLLCSFVPEFSQMFSHKLTGCDEFRLKNGRLRMYAGNHKAYLELSLPFEKIVQVLMTLYQNSKEQ